MAEIEKKSPDPVSAPDSDVAEGSLEAAVADQHMQDIGAELYLEVQQYSKEELEAERKKVLKKIDRVILPIVSLKTPPGPFMIAILTYIVQICITYTLQFLDKLSLNYASAYSLKEDLGLGG